MNPLKTLLLMGSCLWLVACPSGIPWPDATEVAQISGGSFVMGKASPWCEGSTPENSVCDASAAPEHTVTLSGFEMEIHEVTNGQYRHCVSEGGCAKPEKTGPSWQGDYYWNMDFWEYPVVYVTWEMASQYCEWVGRKLPTEAQWEYAARTDPDGTAVRDFPWGDSFGDNSDCEQATVSGCTQKDLPAKVKTATNDVSAHNVYDLGGNVAEWVFDRYNEYQYCDNGEESECNAGDDNCLNDPCGVGEGNVFSCKQKTNTESNPEGPDSGTERVVRGGTYSESSCASAAFLRRKRAPDADPTPALGFRCVSSE